MSSVHILEGGDVNNPENETSPIYGERNWSWTNLPEIIFRIDPPSSRAYLRGPVKTLIENGITQIDSDGQPIRDFGPWLPRRLSSRLEAFR